MRVGFNKPTIAAIVIGFAGFVSTVFTGRNLDANRSQMPDSYTDTDLSMNGSRLKGFALGLEGLLADWYWIRALQYIGDKIVASKTDINIDDLSELNPRLLYPYLDNATDLDPQFINAYSYGAIVLPTIDPEKAILITKKGIANNPEEWRLYQHLGYIYWKLNRYEEAADAYATGAQIKGSAPFMTLMAASMKTEGGSRETSRAIYLQMLAEPSDEGTRITAERRLLVLDSLDERDAIDAVLAKHKETNGRCVNDLREVNSQLPAKLPAGQTFRIDAQNRVVDPTDAPYLLDKEKCVAKLDPERTGIIK